MIGSATISKILLQDARARWEARPDNGFTRARYIKKICQLITVEKRKENSEILVLFRNNKLVIICNKLRIKFIDDKISLAQSFTGW